MPELNGRALCVRFLGREGVGGDMLKPAGRDSRSLGLK